MDQVQFLKNKLVEFDSFVGAGGSSSPLPLDYLDLLRNEQLLKSEEPNFPYRQMVGSLMYAMIGTRPDLATAIGIVCRYLQNPKKIHCELVRHIYRYVRSNLEFKLQYSPSERPLQLVGYADASYANGVDFKSTSGYAYMLGNCLVSWYSGKQSVVAQSSAEAEYYAAVKAANEAIWFQDLLNELGFPQSATTIYEDNQACIALSKNPQDHKRTKHIQVKYHVLRNYVKNGQVLLKYCSTKDQLADQFTKIVSGQKLRDGLRKLGLLRNQGES